MTIIRPDQLFDQAERLVAQAGGQQVDLRRSVSAAYYGLFHTASIAIADHIAGASRRRDEGWNLASRGLTHTKLNRVCEAIAKLSPSEKFKPLIQPAFAVSMKPFCEAVVELQSKRHDADYNHAASFKVSEVRTVIATARGAYAVFSAATLDDRRAFVLLLLFEPRSS